MSSGILNAELKQESYVNKHLTEYISETDGVAKYVS